MAKKQFKTESKRLLDLMIHSIYTHKEIFLRELISNASDAIDKIYYRALTDENLKFDKDDYCIRITPDKEERLLTISDTGIGMTQEELEENLGVIAKSGSFDFKREVESKDGFDIIGQFGVGFYSAFMVADVVTVISRALGSDQAWKWEAKGVDGYTIEPATRDATGTDIILKIKADSDEESYGEYLDEYRLKSIVKKYSDFIRYPIKMNVTGSRQKKDDDKEYETYIEEQVLNSMVPIWRKNKNELKDEDYESFYSEKHFGFDKPIRHIHISADGAVRYDAVLFIPEKAPYDFYTKEYEKGLELYANGVLIMNKCADLLPDYFSFVKGLVDSEDLSLNISRELLQHNRQLKLIAKNIKNKIRGELLNLQKNDREKYEEFYKAFGRQLKYGIYSDFGANREDLQDLILFTSSREKKMVTLEEYVSRMKEGQKYIYYASGESAERIEKLPQTELVLDKGMEILYFTDDVDEFAIRMLSEYKEKQFKSVSGGDLGLEDEKEEKQDEKEDKAEKDLFAFMKETLGDKVADVRASRRLKNHPVCLSSEGELTIEMEKVLNSLPSDQKMTARKVLEINTHHSVYNSLKTAMESDREKARLYTNILYDQALLIEGLPVENPVAFADDICKLMV
jgi:molecular chaperone HtpG